MNSSQRKFVLGSVVGYMLDNRKVNEDNVNDVLSFIQDSEWGDDFDSHLKVEYNTTLDTLKGEDLMHVEPTLNNASLFFGEGFSVNDVVDSIELFMDIPSHQNSFGLYWLLNKVDDFLGLHYHHDLDIFDNASVIHIIKTLDRQAFEGIADEACDDEGYSVDELEEADRLALYAILGDVIDSIKDIFDTKIAIDVYDLNNIYLDK